MASWKPDPSFYPSPRMAMKAAPERLAYVAAFDPERKKPDAIAVVDVDPKSKSYAKIVGKVNMPNKDDELHHFGWNACSSCLCPNAPHAMSLRPSPPRPLRHAGGALGPCRLVLPDGHGPWRRPHALARPDAFVPSGRCRRRGGAGGPTAVVFAGVGIHTLAMLATTAVMAALAYEWLGLALLQRAWLNLDLLWTLALVVTGGVLLLS